MRKYITLFQLLSLTEMSVLVCLIDVLTLTSGWLQGHDLPFRQKAMVKIGSYKLSYYKLSYYKLSYYELSSYNLTSLKLSYRALNS